jgi:hypothetical protein
MNALAYAVDGIAETLAPRPIRAAIYCRISKDPAGDRLGVERQEPICRKICASLGWIVAGVYVDDDISARTANAARSTSACSLTSAPA